VRTESQRQFRAAAIGFGGQGSFVAAGLTQAPQLVSPGPAGVARPGASSSLDSGPGGKRPPSAHQGRPYPGTLPPRGDAGVCGLAESWRFDRRSGRAQFFFFFPLPLDFSNITYRIEWVFIVFWLRLFVSSLDSSMIDSIAANVSLLFQCFFMFPAPHGKQPGRGPRLKRARPAAPAPLKLLRCGGAESLAASSGRGTGLIFAIL